MQPVVVAGIPARRGSTRLAVKMLADIHGEPLIVHTLRRVCAAGFAHVFVATDDDEIAGAVRAAGGEAVRTGPCENGTLRVAQAFAALNLTADVVLNVQGDEPLVAPDTLQRIASALLGGAGARFDIATGAAPLPDTEAALPSRVKVTTDEDGRALAFSRSPIPAGGPFRVHVGVYAFRPEALAQVVTLPETEAERRERLEQLRWLEHGLAIRVVDVEAAAPAVDTQADLDHVRRLLGGR